MPKSLVMVGKPEIKMNHIQQTQNAKKSRFHFFDSATLDALRERMRLPIAAPWPSVHRREPRSDDR